MPSSSSRLLEVAFIGCGVYGAAHARHILEPRLSGAESQHGTKIAQTIRLPTTRFLSLLAPLAHFAVYLPSISVLVLNSERSRT
jgi:hypothetical protein